MQSPALESDEWIDQRVTQITEYQKLVAASEAAVAVMDVSRRLHLRGDFSVVKYLCEQVSFSLPEKPALVSSFKFLTPSTALQRCFSLVSPLENT